MLFIGEISDVSRAEFQASTGRKPEMEPDQWRIPSCRSWWRNTGH